ncbi:MAG: hypothetical protein QF408_00730 [Pirellulales bacterium]|jgi:hypothetical protein|nr:hypothetical protein [Pirellulales bacterium]
MQSITLFLILFAMLATTAANADTIVSRESNNDNQICGTPSGNGYAAIAGGAAVGAFRSCAAAAKKATERLPEAKRQSYAPRLSVGNGGIIL